MLVGSHLRWSQAPPFVLPRPGTTVELDISWGGLSRTLELQIDIVEIDEDGVLHWSAEVVNETPEPVR